MFFYTAMFIYRHSWFIVYNSFIAQKANIIAYTKTRAITKSIGYRDSMVLVIHTQNESNLTNRYWDMVPDGQK